MSVSEDFTRLAEPFRRELLAHCYRMLGSVQDAEDLVQETLLRAWRAYGDYDGQRASLRTWLYRIATNACLTALDKRGRRALPADLTVPSRDPEAPVTDLRPEIPWLQPFPYTLPGAGDPAAIAAERESVRLAFVAALQHLPPRQRAVLILRDVLAWHATEVADLLGTSVAAVNSALQRAHAQLREAGPARDEVVEPSDAAQRELLDQYVAAFVGADMPALTRLLAKDAVLQMPPFLTWFTGRETITRFFAGRVHAIPNSWRAIPISANDQPALGSYLRRDDGAYHPHSIQVLTITTEGVARIDSFRDKSLFPLFGLPPAL
jgi:RNA polymerase sigma-70 factor, ECF subfamily